MIFSRLAIAMLAGLALMAPPPAAAQHNITVRPMQVQADVPANRTARVVLRVRNDHPVRTEIISLEALDLSQNRDGTLRMLGAEELEEMDDAVRAASSLDWLELPGETVEVGPETTEEIPVLLRVPPDARGAYTSAIRLRTAQPPTPEADPDQDRQAFFSISFGFLVPIVLEIEGRPARQDISISGVRMTFDDGRNAEGEEVGEPTTRAFMEIVNDGRTYSRLQGEVVVERRSGANWRTVTRAQLPERNIMPGLTLELPMDLERRLPSGEYRLLGNLSVDGRRLPRVERVIAFEGDPAAEGVAFDTALTMNPPRVSLEAVPGATRADTVEIGNPGEQPLDVSIEVTTPEGLQGVAMGEMRGEDLSAAPWTEIRPAEMTLRAGQSRSVRVMSRLPRADLAHANYYADIVLSGQYEDGQSAGDTRSRLHVRQQRLDDSPAGLIDRMGVSLGEEPGAYILQSRFVNTGNVDLVPELRGELISGAGARIDGWGLTGADGVLLPLGSRDFGGVIDVEGLEPGEYTLRVLAEVDGERLTERQLPVRIAATGADDDAQRELSVRDE